MLACTSCLQVWVCPCRDRNCSLGKSVRGNLETPFISDKTRQTSLDLLSGSYGGLSIKTTCCCGETPDHMVRRFPSLGVFDWVCVFRDWQYLEPVQCMNINIWTFPHAAEFGVSESGIFWNTIRCCVTLLCSEFSLLSGSWSVCRISCCPRLTAVLLLVPRINLAHKQMSFIAVTCVTVSVCSQVWRAACLNPVWLTFVYCICSSLL